MAMQPEQLKIIRKQRGWSQEEMAKRIGVSRVLLGQMERGQAPIEVRTEHLINRMREFMVDLRDIEPKARQALEDICKSFDAKTPGGGVADVVGLRKVETGEVMAICRMKLPVFDNEQ